MWHSTISRELATSGALRDVLGRPSLIPSAAARNDARLTAASVGHPLAGLAMQIAFTVPIGLVVVVAIGFGGRLDWPGESDVCHQGLVIGGTGGRALCGRVLMP